VALLLSTDASDNYDGTSLKRASSTGFSRGKFFHLLLSKLSAWRQNIMRGGKSVRAAILIAAGTVLAFVLGTMASGIYTASSRAFTPVDEKVMSSIETAKSTVPVSRTHLVQPKTVYVSNTQAAVAT